MHTHPFEPLIFPNTKKLLIGTLPPESAKFYFSNSSNTRLWDLLNSINKNILEIKPGSNLFEKEKKEQILRNLKLGITDIIFEYERDYIDSVKDEHIKPIRYKKITDCIIDTQVETLLFVYKNAAKWFLHSLSSDNPVRITELHQNIPLGKFDEQKIGNKIVSFVLLPAPLNRGRKGETLGEKLKTYRAWIK